MLIFIQSIFLGKSIFLISRLHVIFFAADIQRSMLEESINLAGQLKSRESIPHKSILLCDYNVMKIQFLYGRYGVCREHIQLIFCESEACAVFFRCCCDNIRVIELREH